jgi:hypothetical protein
VVIGLDERVPCQRAEDADMFSKPCCEPERWPLERLLQRAGCEATAAYPAREVAVQEVLFDPSSGALCRAIGFGDSGPVSPTHAIVSYYRPERLGEIQNALARSASCRWEIEEITEAAVMLRRSR